MGVCAVLLYIKEIPIGIIDKHPDWKPDSIVDFLLQNLFELIEYVLSYFSNTVSFLRVGAFVIVHASMMMVVFTLGGDGSNIPVIIIGNIIVIALEGLLSGIQGLRLESTRCSAASMKAAAGRSHPQSSSRLRQI